MNGLTKSLLAKVIAIFLLVITFVSGIGCLGAFVYLLGSGCYDGVSDVWKSDVINRMAYRDAQEISDMYWQGSTQDQVNNSLSMENRNFSYDIYISYKEGYGPDADANAGLKDSDGQFYIYTEDENGDLYIEETSETDENYNSVMDPLTEGTAPVAGSGPDLGNYVYTYTEYFYYNECVNKVVLKFIKPTVIEDNYYFYYNVLNKLYEMRYTVIILGLILAIIFIADFIFLMCAAGHRKGTDEIVLNVQDKIPLDLYLCVMFLLFGVGLAGIASISYTSQYYFTVFVLVCGAVLAYLAVIALACCMTLATRIKKGKFWRNTIIYMVLSAVARGVSHFSSSITNIWKWAVLFILFCAINMLLVNMSLFFLVVIDLIVFLWFYRTIEGLYILKKEGENLAAGNLDAKADTTKLKGDLKLHGDNLNSISLGMARAVEQKMKSERFRTELITNVSHDIKTPLTSIINYVDLIKKEHPEGKVAEYTSILDRQSNRLKKLLDDLLEASKASTGNITVELSKTNVCEIVNQAVGEYSERLEKSGVEIIVSLPEEPTYIMADGRKLWRIFDNVLSNICKYSLPNTRAYADVVNKGEDVIISFKNISKEQLNIDSDELMERFVRGDSSRNTEGSGLGLNIARSFAELQHASFNIHIDGDLFKAEIVFKRVPADKNENTVNTGGLGNTDGGNAAEEQ